MPMRMNWERMSLQVWTFGKQLKATSNPWMALGITRRVERTSLLQNKGPLTALHAHVSAEKFVHARDLYVISLIQGQLCTYSERATAFISHRHHSIVEYLV